MNKCKLILAVLMVFAGFVYAEEKAMDKNYDHPATDAYKGWQLGVQAWSFNHYNGFTFYDAIDNAASLGVDWIEAYPGQTLSNDKPGAQMHHDMSKELRDDVKQKLADAGVTVINYGVVGLGNNEAQCRKVFEFAKEMGIDTIASEPEEGDIEMIDKLCKEYKINLALHNHPKPSKYWNPDHVLEVCKGRSKYIGACADTGHWMRSGINPLEALKKLKGRLRDVHLKDLNEAKATGHDVPWGTGKADIKAILVELDRQGYKGTIVAEYEHNMKKSMPQVRQCVEYFNKTAADIKSSGWKDLFENDFSNAVLKGKWAFEDGVLTRKGGGDIWTKDKYSDFVLDLDFKLAKDTNSGVFIRTGNREWIPWIEIQVEDSSEKPISKHICGGIFDVLEPCKNVVKKPGLWNRMTITAKGKRINVVLNGKHVVDMDLNKWVKAHENPDGTKNKFGIAYKDLPAEGFIGLQDHGMDIWYRNVKIKRIP